MYLLRRAWAELRDEVLALPSRTLVLAWVVALLALPAVYGDPYVMRILTMSCLFAIFAASWDLLAGYTGQVNFGHALFFGAGAYTSALVSLKLGVTPWASVFAGAAMATLCGFLAGYLCLRLRGSYLSLATLAFPLIALGLLLTTRWRRAPPASTRRATSCSRSQSRPPQRALRAPSSRITCASQARPRSKSPCRSRW